MCGALHIENSKKGIPLRLCEKYGSEKLISKQNLTWLLSGFSKFDPNRHQLEVWRVG